jgi:hypothetical protein
MMFEGYKLHTSTAFLQHRLLLRGTPPLPRTGSQDPRAKQIRIFATPLERKSQAKTQTGVALRPPTHLVAPFFSASSASSAFLFWLYATD